MIFGLESLADHDAGEPVLITEGIADAITAIQHGYTCLSPVTTTFKHDDRERLAAVLTDADVQTVYNSSRTQKNRVRASLRATTTPAWRAGSDSPSNSSTPVSRAV